MLSATAIFLACTSVVATSSDRSAPERIKHPNDISHTQHMPQRRIRRPERQVPYPKYHPLSRHLLRTKHEDVVENNIIDEKNHFHGQQRRRTEQQQSPGKRRRRPFNKYSENDDDESIIKDKVLLDNTGEFLHYWTVTGRNLITSSTTNEGGTNSGTLSPNKDENNGDESAKLLMDVDQLTSSNSSSSSGSGEGSLLGGDIQTENDAIDEMALAYNNDQGITQSSEIHSEIDPLVSSVIDATDIYSVETESTTEQSSIYQPIRLRAIFTDDQTSGFQYLTDAHSTILMEQIVNPALFAWSKALSVVPVGDDDDVNEAGNNDSLVVDKTQLYDGESCGPGLVSCFLVVAALCKYVFFY